MGVWHDMQAKHGSFLGLGSSTSNAGVSRSTFAQATARSYVFGATTDSNPAAAAAAAAAATAAAEAQVTIIPTACLSQYSVLRVSPGMLDANIQTAMTLVGWACMSLPQAAMLESSSEQAMWFNRALESGLHKSGLGPCC